MHEKLDNFTVFVSCWLTAHSDQHFPGIISVSNSCILKGHIQLETHISHQLIDTVTCLLWEFNFVSFIVFGFLSFYHGLSWSIEPLFRWKYLRSEGILFDGLIDPFFYDFFLFLLVLSLLNSLFNLFSLNRLSLDNFWLIFSYFLLLLVLLLFLLLPF